MNQPQPWRILIPCLFALLPLSNVHASLSVDLSPNSLNLGSQVIATTSGAGSVSFTNHLGTPLSISSISTVGDFAQTNNCPTSLAPGRSCTIKVTFTPSAVGVRSGQLVVTDDDATSPQSVSLSGTGTANGLSSITVVPSNPTVPAGQQQQFTATGYFKNGSRADLTTSVAWSSSNISVAAISNSSGTQGLATGLTQGLSSVTAVLGSISGSATFTVGPPVLTSLAVSPQNVSLSAGKTQQFVALGKFSDGTTDTLTTSVTWTSSSSSVASIANSPGAQGLATGLKQGNTNITATLGGVSGSATLTVVATLTSIAVSPVNPSVAVGKTLQFVAMGKFSDGTTQAVTTSVNWISSDASIATISNSAGSQGLAGAVKAGQVHIAATSGSLTASTILTVNPPASLVSISVSPPSATTSLGKTIMFSATGQYSDGSTQDLSSLVTWQSSSTTIATISDGDGSKGLATGIAVGITTITAAYYPSSQGVFGNATLFVQAPQVDSLSILPSNPTVQIADRMSLTAVAHYNDGTSQDVTSQVVWASGNSAISTVSNALATRGVLTGIGEGTTSISASLSFTSVSTSTSATVTYQPPSSISLLPASVSVPVGDAQQFLAIVTFADGNSLDWTPYVTWASSEPAIATSSSHGRVTAVALGSAVISASLGPIVGSANLTVVPLVPGQARFAYVSNYTDWTLSSYRVDGLTGLLTFVGTTPLGDNTYAASMATDPAYKFLYTANHGSSSISGFAIDPAAGTLSAVAGSPFSADIPWALAIHPSSKFLYVANGSGSALTYSLDGSGVPTYLARTPLVDGGTMAVTVAPSGNFVYTANANANTLSFYAVDANSGTLASAGQVSTGPSPGSVTMDPAGKFLFAANENGQSVSVYSADPNSGVPVPVPGSPFATGQIPDAVVLHPSGNFAYVVNQFSNSISAFAVGPDGVLSPISGSPFAIPDGSGPEAAAVDPLGKWLYVVNYESNNISIFSIDSSSGALTNQGSIATGSNPISIVLTP